jgi:hypothetical protein
MQGSTTATRAQTDTHPRMVAGDRDLSGRPQHARPPGRWRAGVRVLQLAITWALELLQGHAVAAATGVQGLRAHEPACQQQHRAAGELGGGLHAVTLLRRSVPLWQAGCGGYSAGRVAATAPDQHGRVRCIHTWRAGRRRCVRRAALWLSGVSSWVGGAHHHPVGSKDALCAACVCVGPLCRVLRVTTEE